MNHLSVFNITLKVWNRVRLKYCLLAGSEAALVAEISIGQGTELSFEVLRKRKVSSFKGDHVTTWISHYPNLFCFFKVFFCFVLFLKLGALSMCVPVCLRGHVYMCVLCSSPRIDSPERVLQKSSCFSINSLDFQMDSRRILSWAA